MYLLVCFFDLSSGLFDLPCLPEYRASRDMKSLYLLYHCVVGKCFLVPGTLGLPRTCGTMMVMIDDYENSYVM